MKGSFIAVLAMCALVAVSAHGHVKSMHHKEPSCLSVAKKYCPTFVATIVDQTPELAKFLGDSTSVVTFFCPIDAALPNAEIPDGTSIQDVLYYHVVDAAALKSSKLVKASPIPTILVNHTLTASKQCEYKKTFYFIQSDLTVAKVTKADLKCGKGIVHVIDTVLIPDLTMTSEYYVPPCETSPPPVSAIAPPPCKWSWHAPAPSPVAVSSPPCSWSWKSSPPPVAVSSPPACYSPPVTVSSPPMCYSPPVTVSSPPPKCYSPVTVSSPPPKCYSPVTVSSPPPACYSPPVAVSSPPPACYSPPVTVSSPPPMCASPPPVTVSSPPPMCASPPPVTVSSPPPMCYSPPPACSPPPVTVSSPPPMCASPPPVTVSSPPPMCASPPPACSPPPVTVSSPPPCAASPPPYCAPVASSCPSIYAQISADPNLTYLKQLIDLVNLKGALSDVTVTFTFLAPNNNALQNIGMAALCSDTNNLIATLKNHIIPGVAVRKEQFTDGLCLGTLYNKNVCANVANGNVILRAQGQNACSSIVPNYNVQACQSIIHTIDNVLVPSA